MLIRRAAVAAVATALFAGIAGADGPQSADRECYKGSNGLPVCTVKTPASTGAANTPVPAAQPTESSTDQSDDRSPVTEPATKPVRRGDKKDLAPGECAWRLLSPPPPAGDPLWEGHDPSTGVVKYNFCNGPIAYRFEPTAAAAPRPPRPPPPPDPAVLARQAFTRLVLPKPSVRRSPSADGSDPAQGGLPYTIVNLWTWYWTDPAVWVDRSTTVTLRGVSATATATPTALLFDPGDGNASVSCAGPGRPWRESDGNDAPGRGGCGYVYASVTPDGPLTSTVSIRWHATWTGTGGAGGDLGMLTTSATSSFLVEQIQVVNR
jgi:hypothetical protein